MYCFLHQLANERVREAEEEQCNAEADATAARRELHNLQVAQPSVSGLDDPSSLHQVKKGCLPCAQTAYLTFCNTKSPCNDTDPR